VAGRATRLVQRLAYRSRRLGRSVSKAPVGKAPPVRFMVLCRARTGSNLLMSMLEGHPQVLAYGEKLRQATRPATEKLIDRLHGRRAWWIQAVGFKMFHDHPHDQPTNPVWETLSAVPDLHVVNLWRRNLLHVELSETLARRSDHWVQRPDQRNQPDIHVEPITLNPEKLAERFAAMTRLRKLRRRQLDHLPSLDIEFEDLRHNRDHIFGRLCRFLSLPERPARPWTLRQRQRPAHELIANYRELEAHFANTPWAEFFDEGQSSLR